MNKQDKAQHFEQRYRQLYTTEANKYDDVRFSHPRGQLFNTEEQKTIHALLGLQADQAVLDVAAGTGRIAAYLAEQGLQITALDLTRNMLRQAQMRANTAELNNVQFIEGNGRLLPFADAQFDAVISIRFLHLFPVALYQPFIKEMWRMLRPGGVLLVQFDSALSGGGLVTWARELYRRRVLGNKPRYYLWPYQIGQIFDRIENISLYGSSLPGARFVRRLPVNSLAALQRFVGYGNRSFLANRVFVRAIKPDVQSMPLSNHPLHNQ